MYPTSEAHFAETMTARPQKKATDSARKGCITLSEQTSRAGTTNMHIRYMQLPAHIPDVIEGSRHQEQSCSEQNVLLSILQYNQPASVTRNTARYQPVYSNTHLSLCHHRMRARGTKTAGSQCLETWPGMHQRAESKQHACLLFQSQAPSCINIKDCKKLATTRLTYLLVRDRHSTLTYPGQGTETRWVASRRW